MKTVIIDKFGNIENKKMLKRDFIKLFSLNIRDLRPVFSDLQVATIMPRREVLIINLGFIKAILSENKVFLLLQQEKNNRISNFIETLKHQDIEKKDNFYFFILEKILDEKSKQMKKKVMDLVKITEDVLITAREDLSDRNLTQLLYIKKRVSKIETRLSEIDSALRDVLDDDDVLNKVIQISSHVEQDVLEAESIFENFTEQIEDYIGNIHRVTEDVQDTEEFINLKLSSRRTNIVKFDLIATMFTLILSFLAVVVGLFGVNLKNHFEDNDNAFLILSLLLVIFSILSNFVLFIYLKKKKVL